MEAEQRKAWCGKSSGRLREAEFGTMLRKAEGDLSEQHMTFLASFPIDFACGKPTGKILDGDYLTVRCYNCH